MVEIAERQAVCVLFKFFSSRSSRPPPSVARRENQSVHGTKGEEEKTRHGATLCMRFSPSFLSVFLSRSGWMWSHRIHPPHCSPLSLSLRPRRPVPNFGCQFKKLRKHRASIPCVRAYKRSSIMGSRAALVIRIPNPFPLPVCLWYRSLAACALSLLGSEQPQASFCSSYGLIDPDPTH